MGGEGTWSWPWLRGETSKTRAVLSGKITGVRTTASVDEGLLGATFVYAGNTLSSDIFLGHNLNSAVPLSDAPQGLYVIQGFPHDECVLLLLEI